MRFWSEPPETDSLEEALALAVSSFEENRQFAYVTAIITATMAAPAKSQEVMSDVMKMVDKLQEQFFGIKATNDESKLTDKEREDFLKLMEGHALRIKSDQLLATASPSKAPIPLSQLKKQVFVKSPKGELAD